MRKLLVALSTGALLLTAGVSASAKSAPSAPGKACPSPLTGQQSRPGQADAQSGAELEQSGDSQDEGAAASPDTEDAQNAQGGQTAAGHGKGHAKNANSTGAKDKTDEGQSGAQAAASEKDDVEKDDVEEDDVEETNAEKTGVEKEAVTKPLKPAVSAKPADCDTAAPDTSTSQHSKSKAQKADDKAEKLDS